MILADENIDHGIVKCLRENGVEVKSIYEDYRGEKDENIIELAKNHPTFNQVAKG